MRTNENSNLYGCRFEGIEAVNSVRKKETAGKIKKGKEAAKKDK